MLFRSLYILHILENVFAVALQSVYADVATEHERISSSMQLQISIDEYHTEVGSNLYHICEFAERMQKNGATYEPKPAEQTPQHKDLER